MWISQPMPFDRRTRGERESVFYGERNAIWFASGALKSKARFSSLRTERRDTIGVQMKKIILATVLAGLGSTAALAADLGARTHTKAPEMMAAVSNWSGFYIGGNVGYGWGQNDADFNFLPSAFDFNANNDNLRVHPRGVIGGAQFGYNFQIGTNVLGFETDIQGADISGSATKQPTQFFPVLPIPQALLVTDQKLSWFGTARARLGIAITPELLLYETGGFAYGQVRATANSSFAATNFDNPAAVSRTKVGWTAGAGTEWMFARNWSAKAEYLYVNLGSTSAIGLESDAPTSGFGVRYTWKNRENIVRAGVNYHFN
jgi:outer membrane immunogenic protein